MRKPRRRQNITPPPSVRVVRDKMLARTIKQVAMAPVLRRTFAAEAAASASSSLVINFTTPHAPVFSDKVVDKVILPGEDGDYGVTAGHSPIISQLKPGVVTVIHTNVRYDKMGSTITFATGHLSDSAISWRTFASHCIQRLRTAGPLIMASLHVFFSRRATPSSSSSPVASPSRTRTAPSR